MRETAGIARTNEVIRSGIPLPRELAVRSTSGLTVVDANGSPVPAQFRVLARWNAGRDTNAPVQWLLAAFPASVPAAGSVRYRLVTDGSAGPNPAPDIPLTVTGNGSRVTVNTGAASFTVGSEPGALFDEIILPGGGRLAGGGELTARVGGTLLPKPPSAG